MFELALMYKNGDGLERDYKKAKKYFKILSCEYNSDAAQYQLGLIYNSEKKYSKSLKYMELSGKQNNTDALMKLGILYRDGLGVKKNLKMMFSYYEKAAKFGAASALFYLSVFYRDGLGTQKNMKRYRTYGIEEAYLNIGLYYIKENNYEMAKYYWGETNNPKAQYIEARKMYEKAAKQDNSGAIFAIGKLYLNGLGVEEDIDIALDYIIRAARLNNPDAIRIIKVTVDEFERYETRNSTTKQ